MKRETLMWLLLYGGIGILFLQVLGGGAFFEPGQALHHETIALVLIAAGLGIAIAVRLKK